VKLTLRALIMILIFAGSILCNTWVKTKTQIDHKAPATCAWNRLFKSKRRIEKYGVVQQAFVSPISLNFYSTVTTLNLQDFQKPSPVEIFTPPQPPRLFSLI
jgi:hypothetical protein